MSITSLALVKNFLGILPSNSTKDFQLTALMDAAEITIKNYCRRDFESNSYVEYYAGTDRREIILRQTPVTALTGVWVDFYGSFGDAVPPAVPFDSTTQLVIGADCDMDWDGNLPIGSTTKVSFNGCLLRLNTIWQMRARSYYPLQLSPESQSSDGCIKVAYTAGYPSPLPMDLQYAVAFIVAYMRRTIPIGGEMEGEKIGDYQYWLHFPRHIMPPEIASAREILNKYREVVL